MHFCMIIYNDFSWSNYLVSATVRRKMLIVSVQNQTNPKGQGSKSKNLIQLLPLNYVKGSELVRASKYLGNSPKVEIVLTLTQAT